MVLEIAFNEKKKKKRKIFLTSIHSFLKWEGNILKIKTTVLRASAEELIIGL